MMKLALVYHKIHPRHDFGLSSVTPQVFTEHLRYLTMAGFEFTTISNLQNSPAKRSCALVFDDAYRSVVDYAQPVMEAFSISGTVAVIAEYVGKSNTWDVPIGPRFDHCSWSDLSVLGRAGWEIASHSCTHRALVRLHPAEVQRECRASKSTLEDHLGTSIHHFVYPFGSRNSATDAVVRDCGYRTMSGFFAHNTPGWINRRPVYRWDKSLAIERKIRGQRAQSVKDAFIHFWSRATILCQPIWMS